MTCPRCGYVLGPFEKNCPRCERAGNTVELRPDAVVFSGETPPPAPGYCPACRIPSLMADGVCAACGLAPHAVRPKKKQNPVLVFASIAVLVLFVSAAAGLHVASLRRGGKGGVLSAPPAVPNDQIDQRLLISAAKTGGDLEISLAWNSLTDLDLQVVDPSGERITAEHRTSQSGGKQDVDANPTLLDDEGEQKVLSGQKPDAQDLLPLPEELVDMDRKLGPEFRRMMMSVSTDSRAPGWWTHKPVEHTYFEHAPSGTYTIYVRCYSWREPTQNPLPFSILLRSKGKVVQETSGMIGPQSYVADNASAMQVCQFTMP